MLENRQGNDQKFHQAILKHFNFFALFYAAGKSRNRQKNKDKKPIANDLE